VTRWVLARSRFRVIESDGERAFRPGASWEDLCIYPCLGNVVCPPTNTLTRILSLSAASATCKIHLNSAKIRSENCGVPSVDKPSRCTIADGVARRLMSRGLLEPSSWKLDGLQVHVLSFLGQLGPPPFRPGIAALRCGA
jgi:hypothetical protein